MSLLGDADRGWRGARHDIRRSLNRPPTLEGRALHRPNRAFPPIGGPLPPSGRRRGVVLLVAVVEDGFEKFHRSLRNDSEAVQKALSFLPDAGLASGAGTGTRTVAGGGESRLDRGGRGDGPGAPRAGAVSPQVSARNDPRRRIRRDRGLKCGVRGLNGRGRRRERMAPRRRRRHHQSRDPRRRRRRNLRDPLVLPPGR